MELFGIIACLAGAIAVGAVAQLWKRRVGAAWAFFALLIQLLVYVVMYGMVAGRPDVDLGLPNVFTALLLMTAAIGGGVAMLVVVTLPKVKRD